MGRPQHIVCWPKLDYLVILNNSLTLSPALSKIPIYSRSLFQEYFYILFFLYPEGDFFFFFEFFLRASLDWETSANLYSFLPVDFSNPSAGRLPREPDGDRTRQILTWAAASLQTHIPTFEYSGRDVCNWEAPPDSQALSPWFRSTFIAYSASRAANIVDSILSGKVCYESSHPCLLFPQFLLLSFLLAAGGGK